MSSKIEKGNSEIKPKDEIVFDALGNEMKIERKVHLTDKEKKAQVTLSNRHIDLYCSERQ